MVDGSLEMTGLEKASVLLMSLGPEASSEIMKHLSPEQQELLGARIVSMRPVRTVTQQRVLDEVRELVCVPSGECDIEPPLKWMDRLDPDVIAGLLAAERPQNVALVISHLSPQTAAGVLGILEEKLRNQAAHRLATIRSVAPEAVSAVDQAMRKQLQGARERVQERRAGLPTTPEDLVFLPDAQLREVLSRSSVENLRLVLSVASEDLRSAILANAPDDIVSRMRSSEPGADRPRVRDIETAQRSIVDEATAVAKGAASPAGAAA